MDAGIGGVSSTIRTRTSRKKLVTKFQQSKRCSIASPEDQRTQEAPPDTFGTPQNFSVSDDTPTSVALIWQANNAATGFNIYRSQSSAGTYTKINSSPVSGASFGDRGSHSKHHILLQGQRY